jgi:hypothetical protein
VNIFFVYFVYFVVNSGRNRIEAREAVLRGSEAAWRTLYERYFDSLYGYVRWRMKGDTPRTEDVVLPRTCRYARDRDSGTFRKLFIRGGGLVETAAACFA